jgi:RNA polymerase sigma factor (sigma-70 family)
MEDQIAISRLKQGDLNGLETLVGRYQARAVHTAYLIVYDRLLAEDVVQAAFVKVAERIQQFDDERPFAPWFLRIVVNDALKLVKKRQRDVSLEEKMDEPTAQLAKWLTDPGLQPEQWVEQKETRQIILKASLVAGERQLFQQGEKMNTKRLSRIPRLAFAGLVIVALLAVAFATPQGRALAQDVLKFFKPAESTTFPLRPPQMVTNEPDSSVSTAEPPAPLISVAEAETQVGFDVAELPFVPDGFNYLGARLYGNAVTIEYETQGHGGHLIIQQSQEGLIQSEWDRVPAHAIIPVEIGELDGEFIRGTFVVYAGETSATWEPDAPILRLRWVKDGVWFEMAKFGDVQAIEYLDQARLIELAESLAVKP